MKEDCPCKARAREHGMFEGPVGSDWWECICNRPVPIVPPYPGEVRYRNGKKMSKHIKNSFQADPLGWIVGITSVLAAVLLLSTCIERQKAHHLEPVDAVPITE